jgi:hypothetical protein
MDILNWLGIKKQNLIRTTLDSPQDLLVLGADVGFQKRGDKYQSYAIPAEDLFKEARPYKIYTALLTQTGINPPVATILDNTIGNIVWTRTSPGIYIGTLIGAFPIEKTFIMAIVGGSGYDTAVLNGGGGEIYNVYRIDNNIITVNNVNGDDQLNNTPVEIRVYN